jgi:hypothetical protein
LRLALSKGLNRIGVSLPSPEDGNRSSYRNVAFSNYLKFRTIYYYKLLQVTATIVHPLNIVIYHGIGKCMKLIMWALIRSIHYVSVFCMISHLY